MKAPSRLALLAVVVAGAMLSGTGTALAQEDDDEGLGGVLGGVTCTLNLELLGECEEQEAPAPVPDTPPAANTPPAGGESGSIYESGVLPGVGTDAGSDVTVSDASDEDNGAAPVGGVETGAGGTSNDSALAAALAGVGIVTAGGVLFARRNLGRRGGHTA